ncbi:MAG: hypothetical protein KDB00_00940 [Planctomycetales bacterium]|nr:hypothetical protein [Planctomycetales bacterium]
MDESTTITADEMRKRGLPPLEISWRGRYLITQFPQPSMPIYYHGPPGGPDKLYLQILERFPGFCLDGEVKKHDRPGHHFRFGELGDLEVEGKIFRARLWSVKMSPWLDPQATTYLDLPDVDAIVTITFSAWQDEKHKIVTRPAQRSLLSSLTILPKP